MQSVTQADVRPPPLVQPAAITITRERSTVHSRTPVLLTFLVTLPSVEARGRWRERGRLRKR